jgi:Tfp pilus assembly protein PilN
MKPDAERFYAAINRLKFTTENSIKITVDSFEQQQENIATLEKQVVELQKALERIAEQTEDEITAFYARQTLQSLKEDKPNEHSQPML